MVSKHEADNAVPLRVLMAEILGGTCSYKEENKQTKPTEQSCNEEYSQNVMCGYPRGSAVQGLQGQRR